jgi:hypothetical protein
MDWCRARRTLRSHRLPCGCQSSAGRRRVALRAEAVRRAHGSVDQVWITDAHPGKQLLLVDEESRLITKATADPQGSLIFRNVREGRGFRVAEVGDVSTPGTVSARFDVTGVNDAPAGSLYTGQSIGAGYGYLRTRDGTLLSMNVTLPGPADQSPYPTVVEYPATRHGPTSPRRAR